MSETPDQVVRVPRQRKHKPVEAESTETTVAHAEEPSQEKLKYGFTSDAQTHNFDLQKKILELVELELRQGSKSGASNQRLSLIRAYVINLVL